MKPVNKYRILKALYNSNSLNGKTFGRKENLYCLSQTSTRQGHNQKLIELYLPTCDIGVLAFLFIIRGKKYQRNSSFLAW